MTIDSVNFLSVRLHHFNQITQLNQLNLSKKPDPPNPARILSMKKGKNRFFSGH